MTIDVIVQYCVFNDYPIFRQLMAKYRSKFQRILLYPSRHHGVIDLEGFSRQVFPEYWVKSVPIDYGVEDWRQAETTPCLRFSESEWILFMEQDFFVDNWDEFWEKIEAAMPSADAIGMWNETAFPYLHPCFLLIRRSVFEQTNKDFKAHPEIPGCDHYAMITRDLEKLNARITKIEDLGYKEWVNCFHLGGLTYPYQNWKGDGTDHFGVKNPETFAVYNYYSRQAPVQQSPEYIKLSLEIEEELKKRYPNLDLENNEWVKYFKLPKTQI